MISILVTTTTFIKMCEDERKTQSNDIFIYINKASDHNKDPHSQSLNIIRIRFCLLLQCNADWRRGEGSLRDPDFLYPMSLPSHKTWVFLLEMAYVTSIFIHWPELILMAKEAVRGSLAMASVEKSISLMHNWLVSPTATKSWGFIFLQEKNECNCSPWEKAQGLREWH